MFSEEHGKAVTGVTPAALAALVAYEWPGNVRELKNVLESAILFAAGPRIDVADLPPVIRARAPGRPRSGEWAAVKLPMPVGAPSAAPAAAAPEAPPRPAPAAPAAMPEAPAFAGSLVGKTMDEIEREAILTALQISGGNRRKAAEALGIGLRTLQRKLKEYRGEAVGDDDGDEDDGEDGA